MTNRTDSDSNPSNKSGPGLLSKATRLGTGALLVGASPALAVLLTESVASATTYTVANGNDTGVGSLRQAVDDANNNPGADIISFATGVTAITLSSGQIAINSDLTITGPGAANLTIDSNDTSRFFELTSGAGTVSITGMTLTDGNATFVANDNEVDGGAILCSGAAPQATSLTLDDVTLSNNTSTGNSGAIDWRNCGALTITDSAITGNASTGGDGGGGVRLYESGPLVVSGSTVTGNSALYGAGFFLYEVESITITNSTISSNDASGQYGGGVYATASGAVVISDTIFDSNTAYYGGAGAWLGGNSSVTITRATVTDNTGGIGQCTSAGGGMFIGNTANDVLLSDSTFTGNYAYYGGAVYFSGNRANISVTGLTATDNTVTEGGGALFFDDNTTASVADSEITGNSASYGGGIAFNQGDTLTITGSLVADNRAKDQGAGIWLQESATTARIANTTITGNMVEASVGVPAGSGGGVFSKQRYGSTSNSLDLTFTTISDNSASTGSGLVIHDIVAVNVEGSIIAGNNEATNDIDMITGAPTLEASASVLGLLQNTISFTDGGGNVLDVLDAKLDALADNGGTTETMALQADSPAVGIGPMTWTPFTGDGFDQRGTGFARTAETIADAGAFEFSQPTPPPTTSTTIPNPAAQDISLVLDFSVGAQIRGGDQTTTVHGDGLMINSSYNVVLHSDPVEIGAGITDNIGEFDAVLTIPGETPGGSHYAVVNGLDPSGNVVEDIAWFSLDDNGLVTAISYSGPTEDPTAMAPAFTG